MNAFLTGVDDWDHLNIDWQEAEDRAIDAQMDIDIELNRSLFSATAENESFG